MRSFLEDLKITDPGWDAHQRLLSFLLHLPAGNTDIDDSKLTGREEGLLRLRLRVTGLHKWTNTAVDAADTQYETCMTFSLYLFQFLVFLCQITPEFLCTDGVRQGFTHGEFIARPCGKKIN